MAIKVGSNIPDISIAIMSVDGPERISTHTLFANKRAILFAVPAAFSPTCTAKHVPGFQLLLPKFKENSIDLVACLAVNDVFVMKAWSNSLSIGNQMLMLSDGNADFVKGMGLDKDSSTLCMGIRSHRFSMLIDNLKVEIINIDESGKLKVSSAEAMLDNITVG